ncbi:peptidoglycan DD-metalloendopeptidase family protein [Antrihabitans stalactiti]|uniref:peptidoglycan DD-metalloendopeptidase family protein n=1 Tax=Antrihabitans stalactiti TaxID=2584121 RepID=UPI00146DDF70
MVIDIGDGRYAFYAHIKGGSVKVKPGDKVTKGQEIARLGNTGSATEAHLHFQVMAGTQPLTAMNQPSQFEKFTLQGTAESDGFVPATDAGPRTDELLLIRSVISFP